MKRLCVKPTVKLNIDSPLLYLLIALCGINFLDGYFYLAFITFFAVVLLREGRVVVSGNLFLLLLFSLSMMLFGFSYLYRVNGVNGLLKCFLYPISFFIGENMMERDKDNEKRTTHIILIIIFSLALHGILNMFNNFVTGGSQRNSIDFWTQSISAATRQACLFVLLCGAFFWCFFLQKNRFIQAFCLLLVAAMMYYNTVIIASRTLIILIIVGILFPLLLCVLNFSGDKTNARYRVLLRVFLAAILILALYLVLYYTNAFGFKRLIDSSNLMVRIQQGFFRDKRNVSRAMYLELMWKYPFGGNYLREITNRYGHDILLSALNTGGIPSALILLAFLISFIYQTVKLYLMRTYSFSFRVLVFTLYATALIQFALEPILDGEHWFFGCVLIFSGAVNYLIKHPEHQSGTARLTETESDEG